MNPSLWRQSQLVVKGGLYRVVDRLYQVRSADLSNLTIVEGDTGLIVFDPLISVETGAWRWTSTSSTARAASRSSRSCTRTAEEVVHASVRFISRFVGDLHDAVLLHLVTAPIVSGVRSASTPRLREPCASASLAPTAHPCPE